MHTHAHLILSALALCLLASCGTLEDEPVDLTRCPTATVTANDGVVLSGTIPITSTMQNGVVTMTFGLISGPEAKNNIEPNRSIMVTFPATARTDSSAQAAVVYLHGESGWVAGDDEGLTPATVALTWYTDDRVKVTFEHPLVSTADGSTTNLVRATLTTPVNMLAAPDYCVDSLP